MGCLRRLFCAVVLPICDIKFIWGQNKIVWVRPFDFWGSWRKWVCQQLFSPIVAEHFFFEVWWCSNFFSKCTTHAAIFFKFIQRQFVHLSTCINGSVQCLHHQHLKNMEINILFGNLANIVANCTCENAPNRVWCLSTVYDQCNNERHEKCSACQYISCTCIDCIVADK